ncbi:MAG: FAD-binding protein [Defluviitaleaceae bacterium]|nr:FAD-binding protein [Defluviitaleaceae bacterium]
MQILENENLSKYTTIKIGGVAKKFYIPCSFDELFSVIQEVGQNNILILSGGSNLLINDKKIFEHVVFMKDLDAQIIDNKNGSFYCGASVKIQNFIRFVNDCGYGGFEYLFSLPALVGGIIYMNAGRGKKIKKSVSDYIESVYVIRNGTKIKLHKDECAFKYRESVFHKTNDIILGADFIFAPQDKDVSSLAIEERLKFCEANQDNSGRNFGSVFLQSNRRIMSLLKKCNIGFKNGVAFSQKNNNWLLNKGNGTFKQAMFLIGLCKFLHRITLKKIKTEVVIWK